VQAAKDLDEYQSHLARLKTEAEFAAKELEELNDDTTKVISDWRREMPHLPKNFHWFLQK
jgi:hypothetical protein